MADPELSAEQNQQIEDLVSFYAEPANQTLYRSFLGGLHAQIGEAVAPDSQHPLSRLVHSVKRRLKEASHLRDKLRRKMVESIETGADFRYTRENLFAEITDLAGYRILHLHTTQMDAINKALVPLLQENNEIIEGPRARVWDEEYRTYFESIAISTELNPRLYSSVHYIIKPNSKTLITGEIQVRTLGDEIWGEIDHTFNYPHKHDSLACREQIRALARVTSSCTRLVDSIVASHDDFGRNRRDQR
jgi:putative GTP pyrophosphokinase